MSTRTVYLHIGRGKTGTTAIQDFCTRERHALQAAGIHYLTAGDELGHQSLAKSLLRTLPDWMDVPADLHTIQEETRSELLNSSERIFLVSSENLTLIDPQDAKKFFDDIFSDICFKIIFFVRSQDEVAESQYNQDCKWQAVTDSLLDYVNNEEIEELEYDRLIKPWDKAFGRENIMVRICDSRRRSAIADFISCLPISSADCNRLVKDNDASHSGLNENASVGYKSLEIFRFLSQNPLPGYRNIYRSIHQLLKDHDEPAIYFTSAQAREFRQQFRDSNRRFSARYLHREMEDLGGRRYSDAERDAIIAARRRFKPQ